MECVSDVKADEAVAVPGALGDAVHTDVRPPPGTERPRRFRPKLRYELIECNEHRWIFGGLSYAERNFLVRNIVHRSFQPVQHLRSKRSSFFL